MCILWSVFVNNFFGKLVLNSSVTDGGWLMKESKSKRIQICYAWKYFRDISIFQELKIVFFNLLFASAVYLDHYIYCLVRE